MHAGSGFTPFIEPPADTINPALLTLTEGWDAMLLDDAPCASDDLFIPHHNSGGSGAENTPSGISSLDEIPMLSEAADREQHSSPDLPSTPGGSCPEEDRQWADSTDLVMRLPTPPSEPPSESPSESPSEPPCAVAKGSEKPGHRPKSQRFAVNKIKPTQSPVRQERYLKKHIQRKQQAKPKTLEQSISVHPSLTLCELLDPGLRQALEAGEGLIREDLSQYQDSCLWQQDFWSEDAIKLPSLRHSSTKEKFCDIFHYVNKLVTRSLNQKLRLRISRTLLYLTYETLTQKMKNDLHSRSLENPKQQRASTLTADYLLRCSYPNTWDSMDVEEKRTIRKKLHDEKRQGSRWWRAAGGLGLGTLTSCGDVLGNAM